MVLTRFGNKCPHQIVGSSSRGRHKRSTEYTHSIAVAHLAIYCIGYSLSNFTTLIVVSFALPVVGRFLGRRRMTSSSDGAGRSETIVVDGTTTTTTSTMSGTTQSRFTVVERIYIGGLDPPRLSARDMLERLKAIEDVEIVQFGNNNNNNNTSDRIIINDGNNNNNNIEYDDDDALMNHQRPFLHIAAVSKNGSDSALSIIARQYHNVKWKGCKLAVEAAKPSFLDRLVQERQQKATLLAALESKQKVDSITTTTTAVSSLIEDSHGDEQLSLRIDNNDNATEMTVPSPSDDHCTNLIVSTEPTPASCSNLPRRLRIKKKFGAEAYHVDTKPWSVENWSNFLRARSKLQQRLTKHQEKLLLLSSKSKGNNNNNNNNKTNPSTTITPNNKHGPSPLMHRAVHIRFVLDPKSNNNGTTTTIRQNGDGVGGSGGGDSRSTLARVSHARVEDDESSSSFKASSSSSVMSSSSSDLDVDDDDDEDSHIGDSNIIHNKNNDYNRGVQKDFNSGMTSYAWSSSSDDDDDDDDKDDQDNDDKDGENDKNKDNGKKSLIDIG
jgi:hypothetical protein